MAKRGGFLSALLPLLPSIIGGIGSLIGGIGTAVGQNRGNGLYLAPHTSKGNGYTKRVKGKGLKKKKGGCVKKACGQGVFLGVPPSH